jgi:hypothetical protein
VTFMLEWNPANAPAPRANVHFPRPVLKLRTQWPPAVSPVGVVKTTLLERTWSKSNTGPLWKASVPVGIGPCGDVTTVQIGVFGNAVSHVFVRRSGPVGESADGAESSDDNRATVAGTCRGSPDLGVGALAGVVVALLGLVGRSGPSVHALAPIAQTQMQGITKRLIASTLSNETSLLDMLFECETGPGP